jgi:hypothetical protein
MSNLLYINSNHLQSSTHHMYLQTVIWFLNFQQTLRIKQLKLQPSLKCSSRFFRVWNAFMQLKQTVIIIMLY